MCKSCGKGLCSYCLVELPNGLACKNSCEARVGLLNRMIDSNSRVMKIANSQLQSAGIFILVLGLIFLGMAGWTWMEGNQFLATFLGLFAVPLSLWGAHRLVSPQYPDAQKPDSTK